MNAFNDVPNLGKILIRKLQEAEIKNIEQLRMIGSEKAFFRLKTVDPDACINMLYALDGAIQGIRWHQLSKKRKEELKFYFQQLTLNN